MAALDGLAGVRYVRFTTYRRSGDPVHTAVWIAPLPNGDLCFTTGGDSGKVKRLRHTARVTLQASDIKGRVREGSVPVEAVARVVTGDDYRAVASAVKAKYGWQFTMIEVSGRIGSLLRRRRTADAGIVVSPV